MTNHSNSATLKLFNLQQNQSTSEGQLPHVEYAGNYKELISQMNAVH